MQAAGQDLLSHRELAQALSAATSRTPPPPSPTLPPSPLRRCAVSLPSTPLGRSPASSPVRGYAPIRARSEELMVPTSPLLMPGSSSPSAQSVLQMTTEDSHTHSADGAERSAQPTAGTSPADEQREDQESVKGRDEDGACAHLPEAPPVPGFPPGAMDEGTELGTPALDSAPQGCLDSLEPELCAYFGPSPASCRGLPAYASTQCGSLRLQGAIRSGALSNAHLEAAAEQLAPVCSQLTDSAVAINHVVHALLTSMSPGAARDRLALAVVGSDPLPLARTILGSRLLQVAVRCCPKAARAAVVQLSSYLKELALDQSGAYVLCGLLGMASEAELLLRAMSDHVLLFGHDQYGHKVLCAAVERCQGSPALQALLPELMLALPTLVFDQWGNFVVQKLFQHGDPELRLGVLHAMRGHLVMIGCNRFGSRVLEAIAAASNSIELRFISAELVEPSYLPQHGGCSGLAVLSFDQYGNFFVQRVLRVAKGVQRAALVSHLEPWRPAMARDPYAKHIDKQLGKANMLRQHRNSTAPEWWVEQRERRRISRQPPGAAAAEAAGAAPAAGGPAAGSPLPDGGPLEEGMRTPVRRGTRSAASSACGSRRDHRETWAARLPDCPYAAHCFPGDRVRAYVGQVASP
eukprot:TRINITY_DN60526_c0_g1_i1.p1 TRINITY_DN60526_c0_g1~~TRINITY_DN60526_c0_g1_i1.p1  ORF type:complete len:684 (+),score=158.89 TRINITY_DN60526_c0_g1_i1:145-2052(+)